MGISNGDEDGGGVDGDGSGGNSPSRQGARTQTSVPRISSATVAALRNFSWISARFLGFSTRRHLIGEEATRGGARGAHTTPGRGLAWPAPGLHENVLFWSIRTWIEPNFMSRIISIKFPTLLQKTCFLFDVVFEGQTDNL